MTVTISTVIHCMGFSVMLIYILYRVMDCTTWSVVSILGIALNVVLIILLFALCMDATIPIVKDFATGFRSAILVFFIDILGIIDYDGLFRYKSEKRPIICLTAAALAAILNFMIAAMPLFFPK